MTIIQRPSPNHNPRPKSEAPSLIIIHGTAGTSDEGDVSWCCTPKPKNPNPVSYHYIVGRTGQIYQLVGDKERAWHAGVSTWEGRENCNDYSIGVAFSNDGEEPFTPEQYKAGHALLTMLMTKHGIGWSRVVGHQHVSPGRKTDPWLHFRWTALV